MNTPLYSRVHFFDTLRDTIVSRPYVILRFEEVSSLIGKIDRLAKADTSASQALEQAEELRRAIENAKSDGYFPIVVLPARKYEAALSLLRKL